PEGAIWPSSGDPLVGGPENLIYIPGGGAHVAEGAWVAMALRELLELVGAAVPDVGITDEWSGGAVLPNPVAGPACRQGWGALCVVGNVQRVVLEFGAVARAYVPPVGCC